MGDSATTESKPYEPAMPLINQGLGDLQKLYNRGGLQVDPYPRDMVADFNNQQQTGFKMGAKAARQGVRGADMATGTLRRMMNPKVTKRAMNNMRNDVMEAVMPGVNATFAGSGMTGSSLHQQAISQGLSRGMSGALEDMYQTGQNRAMQAAGMMPAINAGRFASVDYLRGIGQDRQDQRQLEINANILRNQQNQQAPIDAIQQYLALTTGAGGMFGSSTTREKPGLLTILGAGMQAAPFF